MVGAERVDIGHELINKPAKGTGYMTFRSLLVLCTCYQVLLIYWSHLNVNKSYVGKVYKTSVFLKNEVKLVKKIH